MRLTITVLGIVVLVGLFWLFKPVPEKSGLSEVPAPASTEMNTTTEPDHAPAAKGIEQPQAIRVEIKDGHRVSGPEVIAVRQGDEVKLGFLSDSQGELHLHGYDLTLALKPDEVAELVFTATYSGRFEYELHGQEAAGHHALGAIEVQP